MKYIIITILFFLPLWGIAQTKTVTPADSLKKYQKLAIRDRDSANKYQHKPGWNEHYYKLKKTRLWQINYWMQQKELLDKLKKNGNQ